MEQVFPKKQKLTLEFTIEQGDCLQHPTIGMEASTDANPIGMKHFCTLFGTRLAEVVMGGYEEGVDMSESSATRLLQELFQEEPFKALIDRLGEQNE